MRNLQNQSQLEKDYQNRFDDALPLVAVNIQAQLTGFLRNEPRVDRVGARAKSVVRFMEKALSTEGGVLKYSDPLRQIQDQIGARIIVFYLADVMRISELVERYYRPIEAKTVVPDSEWEFGYFGKHYILLTPTDIFTQLPSKLRSLVPEFFELQIKTLFQHAWSEANHDLGYKPGAVPLGSEAKRFLALASAEAWGADRIFEQLFQERLASGSDPPTSLC